MKKSMKKAGQAVGRFVIRNVRKACAVVGGVLGLNALEASAATQDWTSVSTAVTAEIGAAMPIALTIFGAIIAVLIGKRIFKAVAK